MGRIRTVKPDFFCHEELYDTELNSGLPTRLAFAGLFTVADREGRFIWKPRTLKTKVLPYDDVDFESVLFALRDGGFITHYEVDNKEYGVIESLKKHQKINNREAASVLPSKDEGKIIKEGFRDSHDDDLHLQEEAEKSAKKQIASPCRSVQVQDSGEGKGREGEPSTTTTLECDAGNRKGKVREGGVTNVTLSTASQQNDLAHEHVSDDVIDFTNTDEELWSPIPDQEELQPPILDQEEIHPLTTNPKARASSQQKQARAIDDIFQYWQIIMDHPNARLDDKRRKLIRNALKTGYAVNDLKTAILGCSYTPHNMGDNDRGQRYDGLHVIFRNADQIDRFIHNAMNQESMDANRENHQRGNNSLSFLDRDLTGTLDELWEKS